MSRYSKNPTSFLSGGHCFICSTENINTNLNSHGRGLCKRFYILVGRYLNLNIEHNLKSNNCEFDFDKTLNNQKKNIELQERNKICCCESCFVDVEVFCGFFEKFSLIQLELNARLNKIAQLMKNKNPRSEENEAQRRKSAHSDHEEKFRNAVVSSVGSGRNNFPRLRLPKLNLKPAKRTIMKINADTINTPPVHQDSPEVVTIDDNDKTGKIVSVSSDSNSNLNQLLHPGNRVTAKVKLSEIGKPIQNLGSTSHSDMLASAFLKCRSCENFYINKKSRAEHEKTHEIQRRFTCRYCDSTFSQPGNLRTHEMGHTGQKPFSCSICHKKFSHRSNCHTHALRHPEKGRVIVDKTHTGADWVEKSTQRRNVFYHQKRNHGDHAEVESFPCQVCGKRFSQKQSVTRHEYIHKGFKPYQCGLCEYQTVDKGQCRLHQWRIHKIRNGVILSTVKSRKYINNDKMKSKSLSAERPELSGDVDISETFMVKGEPKNKNQDLFTVEGTAEEEEEEEDGNFILPDLVETKPTMAPLAPELN